MQKYEYNMSQNYNNSNPHFNTSNQAISFNILAPPPSGNNQQATINPYQNIPNNFLTPIPMNNSLIQNPQFSPLPYPTNPNSHPIPTPTPSPNPTHNSPGQQTINRQSSQLFKQLKQLVYELSISASASQKLDNNTNINTNSNQTTADQNIEKQIQNSKIIISLNHQLHYCREIINTQQKKIRQNQQNWQKTAKQNQNKHRKQIKKYIDLLNQKQTQLQSIKKSQKSLTNRCQSLQTQLQSLNISKNSLQTTITKSIQLLKSNIKQLNYNIQQNQLDKVVLQGKYKQLCDKMENVIKQLQQNQINRGKLQKKYQKIKGNYQEKKYQCVELKFQIEKYRIKVKQLLQQKQNDHIYSANNNNDDKSLQQILNLKQKLTNLLEISHKSQKITNSAPNYSQLFQKIQQCLCQNQKLKQQLSQKSLQYDELQYKILGNSYDDVILQERKLSLYEQLCKMKENIGVFQGKIQYLENIAKNVQENIKNKILNYRKNIQKNGSNSKEKSGKTKTKLKNQEIIKQLQQLITKQRQKFDKQKQKDKTRIKQLQTTISTLKKQSETLKSSIQTLQKQKLTLKSIIQQITEQTNQPKKKTGRTKAKIKCTVCLNQLINATRADKCTNCMKKVHSKCLKNHQCFGKFDQQCEHSSQA